jgi:hypothetical protein
MSVVARPTSSPGQLHLAAIDVRPAAVLRQPVGEQERRVAQRARQRIAQIGGRGLGAHLEQQSASANRASRALSSPTRKAAGASPMMRKVARRIVSK